MTALISRWHPGSSNDEGQSEHVDFDILSEQLLPRSYDEAETFVPFVTFLVKVQLKSGHELAIRDPSGGSDPYVKFKYKGKLLFKSSTIFKNLNPVWNEEFCQLIDDPISPINVEDNIDLHVFDYDRFASDDFMGSGAIDLSRIKYWQPFDLKLSLLEENNYEYMGYLQLIVTMMPQTAEEQEQVPMFQFMQKAPETMQRKAVKGVQIWSSIVNIVLVEAKELLPTDACNNSSLPDPFVKFKLGTEKCKSKTVLKTLEPKWLEQYDLHLFEECQQSLEITVHDKRSTLLMGRCSIDLSKWEREVTHQQWFDLEGGVGSILLLLSISGTSTWTSTVDLTKQHFLANRLLFVNKYKWFRSFSNIGNVGYLTVKVFKANGLATADIGGKSDPFAVIELVNSRLQTQTEYRTLNPEWNKLFTFNIKDIHSILEITIYDENPNMKVEFLGKVVIPLLKIRNGEKRWYALKDKKLRVRAKGQILLEMDVIWNPFKAAIRTFNPKEQKYISQKQKFKRQLLIANVQRLKHFAIIAVQVKDFVQNCFAWKSPVRSALAFIFYVIFVYCFELHLIPVTLLLIFLKVYISKLVFEGSRKSGRSEQVKYFDSEDEDGYLDDKGGSTSLKDRLNAVQNTLALVQNILDFVASTLERIKNTFNFTSPYLSCLAIIVLCAVTVLLYFMPLRWLLMAWGINKFTKKLRNPNSVDSNNELLDFLSRMPSDNELQLYAELRPEPVDNYQAMEYIKQSSQKKPWKRAN